jgi:hypothetical protein
MECNHEVIIFLLWNFLFQWRTPSVRRKTRRKNFSRYRRRGFASHLAERAEECAASLKIEALYLLTTAQRERNP